MLGRGSDEVRDCGVFDREGRPDELRDIVSERDPQRIAVNMTSDTELLPMEGRHLANGLSHTDLVNLKRTLGEPQGSRLASAEKRIAQFRGRRVALELLERSGFRD